MEGTNEEENKIKSDNVKRFWDKPPIRFAFNLPRVSAQLEKLMGTNVVRLTDRKYMQDLRTRIKEDYKDTLQKRINQREHEEIEREKRLIFNGNYSPENCPSRLINMHSIALAREMERERNLIMKGKGGDKLSREFAEHPVFLVNQKTNDQISKTRSKLRTNREINAERLIKQGAKWEKERALYDEMDRLKELEMKTTRENDLLMRVKYAEANEERGMDLLRIKNHDYTENEMDLKEFLDSEKQKMLSRVKHEDKRKKDFKNKIDDIVKGKDDNIQTQINFVDETKQNIDDEETSSKLSKKSKIEQIVVLHSPSEINTADRTIYSQVVSLQEGTDEHEMSTDYEKDEDDYELGSLGDSVTTSDHRVMLSNVEAEEINKNHMLEKKDFEKLHYEDPRIMKLKQTDNVLELYGLADEIIGGTSSQNTKLP